MTEPESKIARIEDRIDRGIAGATAINMSGVKFQSMSEVLEFSKLMSVAGDAIPPHLRGNPGACLSIVTRALRNDFEPFALAEHSYLTKKKKQVNGQWIEEGTIAFDSFVIHAIVEAHAPLVGRLRCAYEGEGLQRRCIVTGLIRGEQEPHVYKGPTLEQIVAKIGRNEAGKIKGSPLWEAKPDQQMWYDARRDWCRAYCPEVLLGWYDREELEDYAPEPPKPSPNLLERLKDREVVGEVITEGFNRDKVHAVIDGKAEDAPEKPEAAQVAPELSERASAYLTGAGMAFYNCTTADELETWWKDTAGERKAAKLPGPILGALVVQYDQKLQELKKVSHETLQSRQAY